MAKTNVRAAKGRLSSCLSGTTALTRGFKFETDEWSGPTPALRGDVYAHQMVTSSAPYDGMLVSLAQIKKKKGVLKNGAGSFSTERSVREQLNLPDGMRLMGDCGAFSYLDEPEPPYSPEEAARLYDALGFDIGASVDHVVFPGMTMADDNGTRVELTPDQLQQRVKITRENAQRFLDTVRTEGLRFTPMGVVQAVSVKQFGDMFVKYVDMGYEYVALGGLVPKRTEELLRILREIKRRRQELRGASGIRLHLFGVMREELVPELLNLGVASFDSASYLRKAWLRSEKNYLSCEHDWYAAIRVPFHKNSRVEAGGRNASELGSAGTGGPNGADGL